MVTFLISDIQHNNYTVQHKTLAGENFNGFPVNRQSFIHQILGFQNHYSNNRQNFIRQLFHII